MEEETSRSIIAKGMDRVIRGTIISRTNRVVLLPSFEVIGSMSTSKNEWRGGKANPRRFSDRCLRVDLREDPCLQLHKVRRMARVTSTSINEGMIIGNIDDRLGGRG